MPGHREKDLLYPDMWIFPKMKIDGFDSEGINALRIMLRRMEAGEVLDAQRKKPSLVETVYCQGDADVKNWIGFDETRADTNATNLTWSGLEYLAKRKRKRPSITTTTKPSYAGGDCYSNVEPAMACFRKKLPKYLDSSKQRLFTRGEFRTGVLHEWEQEMEQRCPPNYKWKARLLDDCPNDPNAYLLEVTVAKALREMSGQQKLLDMLRTRTEEWIQSRIRLHNTSKLLGDGESLLFDIMIAPGEPLGAKFKRESRIDRKKYPQNGVWMTRISQSDVGLAKALDSVNAFEAGFAIVAIDDEPCIFPETLESSATKSQTSNITTKVSVCLSKYANLEGLDLSKIHPRRRDLKPFDPDYYEGLKTKPSTHSNTSVKSLPMVPPHTQKDMERRSQILLKDENSIMISLTLFCSDGVDGLGAKFVETSNGLWASDFEEGGQLWSLLGSHPCTWGALLTMANGVALRDESLLQNLLIKEAKPTSLTATFVLFDGTDLGGIDHGRLVQNPGWANPQRISGEPVNIKSNTEMSQQEQTPFAHVDTEDDESDIDEEDTNSQSIKRKSTRGSIRLLQVSKRPRLKDDDDDGDDEEEMAILSDSSLDESDGPIDKLANFKNFKEKYKPLVDIEYSAMGIARCSAFSSMWRVHKEIYGEEHLCNGDCKCYTETYKLTKHVIKDYIAKQEKKGIRMGSIEPAGIACEFAPRFFPLLAQEYPELSSIELIQRLADMWRFHKMQKTYGLRCCKDCLCKEEWESLFCKGNIKMAEENLSTPHLSKRRKIGAHSHFSRSQASVSYEPPIPRKSHQCLVRNPSSQKNYEIAFDTHAPLGAYFVTERGKCKVHSIYSKGQFKKDTRLCLGRSFDAIIWTSL
jgi:hypothetical protein